MRTLNTVNRLRIAHVLLGMMFFYGIEQVFLNKIIGDPTARGYVTIAYTASLVIFDIPTGMIADRFGRKLCLIAACFTVMVALLVLGLSSTLWVYLGGCILFGLYISLFNGASQAFLYDWLATESKTKLYGKYQGSIYAAFLLGAGIANAVSGFLVHPLGIRSPYMVSIIPSVLALVIIMGLKEPPLEKKAAVVWYGQLREVLAEITRHRKVIVFALQFTATGVILLTIGEFGQIYMLSFGISTVALGIFWAIDALFASGGRLLAHTFQKYPRLLVSIFCVTLFAFAMVKREIGIGLFWLLYGLNEALANVAETEIQDETSSHIRATTLSVVSFAGNIVAIPLIFLYNNYYAKHGILSANRVASIGVVIILLATLFVKPSRHHDDAADQTTIAPRPELSI